MKQCQEYEQTIASGSLSHVRKDVTPSSCEASTCSLPVLEELRDSESSTEEEHPDPLFSWPDRKLPEKTEEVEEVEETSVAQPAMTTSASWVVDTPTQGTAGSRIPGLAPFDEQRFKFLQLLNPAVRNGVQIELYLDKLTGATVVAKRVPAHRLQAFSSPIPDDTEDPWQEMAVTTYLGGSGLGRVPGVCACHGAFRSVSGDAMLVSDYLLGGDLFDVASKLGEPGPHREQQAWFLIRSLLEAIMTVHSRGVAHGDVSLENILMQRGCSKSIALIDFGMAVTGDLTRAVGVRGKPSYHAPEMHTERFHDARCADLFACGVTAYALAMGSYPWTSTRPGTCAVFGYAQKHGIEAFFHKRKVSVCGVKKPLNCLLSARYKQLLLTLLSLEPLRRFEVSSWQFMHGSCVAQLAATAGVHGALAGG